ncbi:HNH endonuclease signature motif containing protein [Nocardioides pelophilus]|uniref:HNH endonuclease signature motif containing protein n=1 Tax=Nocardioides pelophilus TaxID=2172019 RepID=UPI001601F2C4|nr:HNH endonuclease signature motif containing protein [Nocardioides pelophilus]
MVAQLMPQPHPILACADQVLVTVEGVRDVQPVYLPPADKQIALVELGRAAAALEELRLRVLASAGDVAEAAGARDVGSWAAVITRAEPATARADARLAESLDRRWTRVAAGMADGRVAQAQARVVVAALEALPSDLDPDLLADAETRLVDWCAEFNPTELRRLGRRILEVVAPEIAEAHEAKLLEQEELRAREKTSLKSRLIGDGMARTTIVHPELDRTRLLTYLDAFTSPRKHDDALTGEEDRIPHHRKLGQAFGALLEHLDPAKLPVHGGDATTVMVTITLESLMADLATGGVIDGNLSAGDNLSATQVRRLACTAQIIPVVLGGKGEILDLGRARRRYSPAQRKAMRLRDKECRAEGCTIPATWCEAHHLKPWSKGGKTDLDDGILACSWHHHRLHDPRYGHQLLPNGALRFHRRP